MPSTRLASRAQTAPPAPPDGVYRALWEASGDACLVADAEGIIILANPAVLDVLCYVPERLLGRHLSEVRCVLPSIRDSIAAPRSSGAMVAAPPSSRALRATVTRGDGMEIAVDVSFATVELDGASVRVARYRDATANEQALDDLTGACSLALGVLDSLPDGMLATDLNGLVTHLNQTAAALVGWNPAAAIGLPWDQVVRLAGDPSAAGGRDPVSLATTSGQRTVLGNMAMLVRSSGEVFPIEGSVAAIAGPCGKAQGAVLLFRDASFARRLAVELRHRAVRDALTGLLNRDEFLRRLGIALADATARPVPGRLMYFDLRAFASVNRTLGHAAGDALLRQLAVALAACVRKDAPLARLGSDCFALVLREDTLQALDRSEALVRQAVDDVSQLWQARCTPATVSIVSVDFHNRTLGPLDLLIAADQACMDNRQADAAGKAAPPAVSAGPPATDLCTCRGQGVEPFPRIPGVPVAVSPTEGAGQLQA